MNEIELAWAAGFFDGEGWSSARKNNGVPGVLFGIGVEQKDIRALERFVAAVGLQTKIKCSDGMNAIAASGEKALRVMQALWPYLGEVKREQFVRTFLTAHYARSRQNEKLNAVYDDAYTWLEQVWLRQIEGR